MSDNYYVETIKRITEQMIEEEILNDIEQITDEYLELVSSEKRKLILALADQGIRKDLKQIDSDTDGILQNIKAIAPDTVKKIEQNIKEFIASKYEIQVTNDGTGAVTAKLVEKVI